MSSSIARSLALRRLNSLGWLAILARSPDSAEGSTKERVEIRTKEPEVVYREELSRLEDREKCGGGFRVVRKRIGNT